MKMALTHEQAMALVVEYQKAILPAKLNMNGVIGSQNLILLASELRKQGLEENLDNLLQVTKQLVRQLTWDVKPASLAKEDTQRPRNQLEATRNQGEFAAKSRAADAAHAKVKADEKILKETHVLIDSFAPIDRRTQRVAHGRKETVQSTLRTYVEKEVARRADAASIRDKVRAFIEARYREDEQASERL
jgi:hypothetical protein